MLTSDEEAGADVTLADSASHPVIPGDETNSPSVRRFASPANLAFVGVVAVLPVGAAVLTHAVSSKRSRRALSFAVGAGVAVGLACVRWQMVRWFTEQPAYEVERRIGDLEVRFYPPMVVAETTLARRDWRGSLDEGFRRLAGYIFGGNSTRERVGMTSPVQSIGREGAKEKLSMTAPVMEISHPGESHTIVFVMPRGRSLESLPVPHDDRVRLRSIGARHVAVLRFSGTYRGDRVKDKTHELLEKVERSGLERHGEPHFAGYDPPTTLPFLRRNEVWVDVGVPELFV